MRRRWSKFRADHGLSDTLVCEQCGTEYTVKHITIEYRSKRRFCSEPCRIAARKAGLVHARGADHHAWKGDEAKVVSIRARGRIARLRREPGYCEGCGFMLATETHHKDENPLNDDPENYAYLCMGCHDLAHKGETIWDPPMAVAA